MAAMTVGRGRGKGAIVNQLRFEAGLGHYSVNVAPDSVWIFRGWGRTTSRSSFTGTGRPGGGRVPPTATGQGVARGARRAGAPGRPVRRYNFPLTDPVSRVGTSPLADVPGLSWPRLPALTCSRYLTPFCRWDRVLEAGVTVSSLMRETGRASRPVTALARHAATARGQRYRHRRIRRPARLPGRARPVALRRRIIPGA